MRRIIGFVILSTYLLIGAVWAQSPMSLLDKLSQSPSASASAGLIAQIWTRWTGAATDDKQQRLMQEPRHFGALSGLGLINMKRGDLSNAIRAYEKVLQIDPFSQDARMLLPKLRKKMDKSNL